MRVHPQCQIKSQKLHSQSYHYVYTYDEVGFTLINSLSYTRSPIFLKQLLPPARYLQGPTIRHPVTAGRSHPF